MQCQYILILNLEFKIFIWGTSLRQDLLNKWFVYFRRLRWRPAHHGSSSSSVDYQSGCCNNCRLHLLSEVRKVGIQEYNWITQFHSFSSVFLVLVWIYTSYLRSNLYTSTSSDSWRSIWHLLQNACLFNSIQYRHLHAPIYTISRWRARRTN